MIEVTFVHLIANEKCKGGGGRGTKRRRRREEEKEEKRDNEFTDESKAER